MPLGGAATLLDTGRAPDGGMTATLGSRKLERHAQPAGEELVAIAVDSPGTELLSRHRSVGNALLTQAIYEHTFRAYLCVWADMTGQDHGGGAGDRLYAALADFEWKLEGTWTVNWPNGEHAMDDNDRRNNPNWWQGGVVAETRNFRAWISQAYNRYPQAQPAEGHLEVRAPTPLTVFAWDSR